MDPRMMSAQGMGGGQGMFNYQPGSYANIFHGLFGNAGRPYEEANEAMSPYYNQAQSYQEPFYNAGKEAIPHYQQWLQGQQDPSGFINNLMGKYQESPYAQYQQQQAMRAAQNMGSATGLIGSTPLTQYAQQNARDISSQDQNQWLQNVLGINTQYGAGQAGLMGGGQNAANALMQLLAQRGMNQGELAYGKEQARQGQQGALFGGITGLFGL